MSESVGMAVIGVGNEYRGDDGAGIAVVRALHDLSPEIALIEIPGDGAQIMDAMSMYDEVVLVDASRSTSPAGTIREFDASRAPLPVRFFSYSTHAFGLAEAIEVARAMDRLPRCVTVWSIEGGVFESGLGMSVAVARAASNLASVIRNRIPSGAQAAQP